MDRLADVIGESNSGHFFVIPAVPAIFALIIALFLESQQQLAKVAEGHSRLNKL
ncbi:hypothetical protein Hanom_Chr03g00216441 [Helianthus anomalus]